MELAIVYQLNPPKSLTADDPITYTCQECGANILAYNASTHARDFHNTSFYHLSNVVTPTPLDDDVAPFVEPS